MKPELKDKILPIVIFIVVITIIVFIIQLVGIGTDYLRKKLDLSEDITPKNVENIVSETIKKNEPSKFPDYDYYKNLPKLELALNVSSWVKEVGGDNEVQGRIVKKFIKSNGEIENAYLFVDISVDNGKQLKVWDSVYISLQKIINGYKYIPVLDGHFYKGGSINVPTATTSSRYLFDLKEIPFINKRKSKSDSIYSEGRGVHYLDWLNMLKNAKEFEFNSFVSSLHEGGMINNISIGYECSKKTPSCKLEIKE